MSENKKIEPLSSLIRDVVNSVSSKVAKERFQFDSDDWNSYCSSLDILCDSQKAIKSFFDTCLGNKLYSGEDYLKLYGVLSAVYTQQQVILELSTIFKIDKIKELKKIFDDLEITFLRNCILSKPIIIDSNNAKVSYKLDFNSPYSEVIMRDHCKASKYNIFNLIDDYTNQAEKCLVEISKRVISSCYGTSKESKKWINKLEQIQLIM